MNRTLELNLMFFRLALLVLSASLVPAAEKDGLTPAGEPGEVVLDVVVRDSRGRLIEDLTGSEFRITDGGTPAKPARVRLAGPADSGTHPRLITLLFERFGPEGRDLAREGALALLKSAAGPGVYFAVLSVDAGIHLLQPFTTETKLTQAAIERATSSSRRRDAPGANAPNPPDPADVLSRMLRNVVDPSNPVLRETRGGPSLQALLSLAREERLVPGRKTLLFFCEGLQVSETQRQQFQDILEAANRAHLSIYPIDVSGLTPDTSPTAPSTGLNLNQSMAAGVAMANSGLGAGDVHRIENKRAPDSSDALNRGAIRGALADLAAQTGGVPIVNTNDLRRHARRIAEEALTYYEIAYIPPTAPLDGRFRPVEVLVDRPKVVVQSRNGYRAVPPVAGDPMQGFEVPLFGELSTQPARHDFPHSASVVPLRAAPGGVEYAVLVETLLGDFRIQEDAPAAMCRLHGAALAVVRDASGKVAGRFALDGPFQGPLDRKDTYRSAPWLMEERIVLAPGSYMLETVVSDLIGERASVQRRQFTVAPWESGPHVSALTYVRSLVSTTPGTVRAFQARDKAIEPQQELRLAGGKGSTAAVYFLLRGAGDSSAPVQVKLAVSRGGAEIANGVVFEGAVNTETPLMSTVDASSLPAGTYELRLQVTQSGKSSTSALPFTVAGSPGPGPSAAVKIAPRNLDEWDAAPPTGEQKKLLEVARQRALGYIDKLPNFICLQTTRRLEDPTGRQEWRQKDEYAEVITWYNGLETYSHVGGRDRSKDKRTEPVRVTSAGEFGSVLRTIFLPESKAEFRWVRSETVAGRTADVFAYRIQAANSQYNVTYFGKHNVHVRPGYHGTVSIDGRTAEAMHLDAEMEELPGDIHVGQLRLSVDYDTATVADREFLLPSAATLLTQVGPRLMVRNEMRFSGYRRFETASEIQYGDAKP